MNHDEIDMDSLLGEDLPQYVIQSIREAIRRDLDERGNGSGSIQVFETDGISADLWLDGVNGVDGVDGRAVQPLYGKFELVNDGSHGQLCRYDAHSGTLSLNVDHPFGSRIVSRCKEESLVRLIAVIEILTYSLVRSSELAGSDVRAIFRQRDHALRRFCGEKPMDAATVLRHLRVAGSDARAMEVAVGRCFEMMGFEYSGGGTRGPDGIVMSKLGCGPNGSRDYTVVYDAKTSSHDAIAANRVDVQALADFAHTAKAEFSLVVGHRFENESDPTGALNRRVQLAADKGSFVTVLRTHELLTLVKLHYRFGLTFTEMRDLFETAHTVPQTIKWVTDLKDRFAAMDEVPLGELLRALEREKCDPLSMPEIHAARANSDALKPFEPKRLLAALRIVVELLGERWISIEEHSYVRMEQSAAEIIHEFERRLAEDLEVQPQVFKVY